MKVALTIKKVNIRMVSIKGRLLTERIRKQRTKRGLGLTADYHLSADCL